MLAMSSISQISDLDLDYLWISSSVHSRKGLLSCGCLLHMRQSILNQHLHSLIQARRPRSLKILFPCIPSVSFKTSPAPWIVHCGTRLCRAIISTTISNTFPQLISRVDEPHACGLHGGHVSERLHRDLILLKCVLHCPYCVGGFVHAVEF